MPPLASSKRPGLRADRAGEGAALVAEELALDQVLGDRRAVDLDERLVAARRVLVQRARDELLAGAALAGDEHGGRRVGDALEHGVELEDGSGSAPMMPKRAPSGARPRTRRVASAPARSRVRSAFSTIVRTSSWSKGLVM